MKHHIEIESEAELERHLDTHGDLSSMVLQSLDLAPYKDRLKNTPLEDTVFLGCTMPRKLMGHILNAGGLVFPRLEAFPFNAYRNRLYRPMELLGDYRPGESGSYDRTLDGTIYNHFVKTGKAEPTNIMETLARRLHDHA
ncbi:MAG: hypothetical protein AAF492_29325, partial [Verrucomicrobiota bacterium]